MKRRWFASVIALVLSVAMVPQATFATAASQSRTGERCFLATGYCISGPIRSYWEHRGGLAVFGYPISSQAFESADGWYGPVQWFERDRLEDHGSQGVMAGRLGAQYLELLGQPWQSLPQAASAPAGCRYFPQTQHSLCQPFLRYWTSKGGLERFGYPISEPRDERVGSWEGTVQYFERRRMEHHQELARTPYEILLGLLGRSVYDARIEAANPFRDPDGCYALGEPFRATALAYRYMLGCPSFASRELVGPNPPGLRQINIVTQPYEHGAMLWYTPFASDVQSSAMVMVLFAQDQRLIGYQQFQDTWRAGDPAPNVPVAPAGLVVPVRGFGKIWSENPSIRERLGWATAPESGELGGYRHFANGFMVYRPAVDRVYIISESGAVEDVPRIR